MTASIRFCGRPKPVRRSSTKSRRSSSSTPPAPASLPTRRRSPRRRSDAHHTSPRQWRSSPGVAAPLLTISRALGGAAGRSATGRTSLLSAAALVSRIPPAARGSRSAHRRGRRYTIAPATAAGSSTSASSSRARTRATQALRFPASARGGRPRAVVDSPPGERFRRSIDRDGDGSRPGHQARRPAAVPRGAAASRRCAAARCRRSRVGRRLRDPRPTACWLACSSTSRSPRSRRKSSELHDRGRTPSIGAQLQPSGRLVYSISRSRSAASCRDR